MFTANTDQNTIAKNLFNREITAQFVRISPVDWHAWPAMRFNILGCNKIPQPTTPAPTQCVPYWTKWVNMNSPDRLGRGMIIN